jgi:hypothetical protein
MMGQQQGGAALPGHAQRQLGRVEGDQHPLDLGGRVANLKSAIVPFFSEGRWKEGMDQADQVLDVGYTCFRHRQAGRKKKECNSGAVALFPGS